jgi:hypothetical protein
VFGKLLLINLIQVIINLVIRLVELELDFSNYITYIKKREYKLLILI